LTHHAHTGRTSQRPFTQLATLLAALPILLGHPARAELQRSANHSQTWRCTTPSGQISYSQQPCAAAGELLTLKDERSLGQRRQATENTLRDAKLSKTMRAARLHEERLAYKAHAISLSGKGGPHVIQSTANHHAPAPISEKARLIRIKQQKQAPSPSTPITSGTSKGGL
jgi:hypothetical protein